MGCLVQCNDIVTSTCEVDRTAQTTNSEADEEEEHYDTEEDERLLVH